MMRRTHHEILKTLKNQDHDIIIKINITFYVLFTLMKIVAVSAEDEPRESQQGAVAGGAVGGTLAAILVICVVLFVLRRYTGYPGKINYYRIVQINRVVLIISQLSHLIWIYLVLSIGFQN